MIKNKEILELIEKKKQETSCDNCKHCDLNGLFEFGMILKESPIGIQTISQDYIEFLLENNGLSREDCLCVLSKYIG